MTRADRGLPEHAYVPGQTPRHTEGRFAPICATARQHMSPVQLAQSEAFCTGLYYFRSGYFWEAHELFEPVWMALGEGSDDRRFLQALIQLANAQLKIKMQRPKAAKRLCMIVRDLLTTLAATRLMGQEISKIVECLEAVESHVDDVL